MQAAVPQDRLDFIRALAPLTPAERAKVLRAVLAKDEQRPLFQRIPLYPKQAAIVDDPARFTITEATTKAGKTASHIEWILERASMANEGQWWWVAQISDVADIAFRRSVKRLQGYLDTGGEYRKVAEPLPFKQNQTRKFIELGGATIWFKSADEPDSLFGEDVRGAVGDEITRWKEQAWFALYTTLTATRGCAKLIGNVKGRKNFAYTLARKAESGEADWGYHKLTADDAIEGGVLRAEIIEQARRDLPEAVFRELYFAEPSDDGGNPFGLSAIRACIAPMSTAEPFVWGWDLAKSVDWTVGLALDAKGATCRLERWQGPWDSTKLRIKTATGRVPAEVDSTGVGDPVLEDLQKGGSNYHGFKFSSSSKQQLMEGLAVAIQQRQITFPEGVISSELESYEYEYTRTGVRYSAPEGMHDDCVCALALAVNRYRRRPVAVLPKSTTRQSPWVVR